MYRVFAPVGNIGLGVLTPFTCPSESFYRVLAVRVTFGNNQPFTAAELNVDDGARTVASYGGPVGSNPAGEQSLQFLACGWTSGTVGTGNNRRFYIPIPVIDLQPGWSITPVVTPAATSIFRTYQYFVDDIAIGTEADAYFGAQLV